MLSSLSVATVGIASYRFDTDVLANLKRVCSFTRGLAGVAVPAGEQASMESGLRL